MHSSDLIGAIAARSGTTRKAAAVFLSAFTAEVSGALQTGSSVKIMGFGVFEVRRRHARRGVKPGTNEPIMIPTRNLPVFRASKNLKDAIR
jgi:DNA-binding protein HU-beta